MPGYQEITYEIKNRVGVITINRPEAMNAMTYKMRDELAEVIARIKDDPAVGAAVITGAGDKAFMSGADIRELDTSTPILERKEIMMRAHRLCRALETLGKPVIAAVNGVALGGGCELCMACTFRIAAENARFGQPEIKLGMIPGYGGSQRLPRLVGKARALEMLLLGGMIDAQEAHRIGLVNRVVPLPELMPAALDMADKLAQMPPLAVKFALAAVDRGLDLALDQALELEADYVVQVFSTEDAYEGLKAFIEKRRPVFKGR
jgi:enoyl-CoA hydratase